MPNVSSQRFIPQYGDISDPLIRKKYGFLEAKISIAGNIALFVLKLVLGMFINSIALIADAVHTISDTATSGVVIFGFKFAARPSDQKHPFGHGRIEYIATMIIAILLIFTGIGFIEQSVRRGLAMVELSHQEFTILIGIVVIVSAVLKEVMARFSFGIGRKIKSEMLIADAWHHRTDAFSSIGVGLSIIGSTYGFPWLDPLFGGFVSMIIVYVGINIVRTSANYLIGAAPDPELVKHIQQLAEDFPQVHDAHAVRVHDYGIYKVITLHIHVDKDLTVERAHAIADNIERKICEETGYHATSHIEPAKQNS